MLKALISNSLELVNNAKYDALFTDSPFVFEKYPNSTFIEDILYKREKDEYIDAIETLGEVLNKEIINKFLSNYKHENNIYFFRPHVFLTNLFIKCKSIDEIKKQHPEYTFKVLMDEIKEKCILTNPSSLNKYGNIYSEISKHTNINVEYRRIRENPKPSESKRNIIYEVLRVISLPLRVYVNMFLEKINLHTKFKSKIFVYHYNESTRDIKNNLMTQGIGYLNLTKMIKDLDTDIDLMKNVEKENKDLLSNVDTVISAKLDTLQYLFHDISYFIAFKKIFTQSIFESLVNLKKYEIAAEKKLIPFLKKNKDIKIILSHALFGIKGLALTNIFKKNNVKIITSIHGLSIGFGKVNDLVLPYNTDSLNADFVFCFNQQSKETFSRILKNKVEPIELGTPYELRENKFKFLKRFLSKKLLNINNDKECIFFVSTLEPRNNFQMLKCGMSTKKIYQLEKKILILLSKLNKRIIYKTYDASLYLDDNLNIEFAKKLGFDVVDKYDFRYVKNLGDILLSISATSTTGWCIGTDKPFVYLDSNEQYQLQNKKVQGAFKESFFVFNYDKNGWEQELSSFLNKPFEEILHRWNEKEKNRQKYNEKYFLSNKKNAGKLGAQYIKGIM